MFFVCNAGFEQQAMRHSNICGLIQAAEMTVGCLACVFNDWIAQGSDTGDAYFDAVSRL